jgi:hypothetical protein
MHRRKTATSGPIALIAALAMVLPAACGGNGTGAPAQASLPATASGIGDTAAPRDVSGEFTGTVTDSFFGTGRASIELSQSQEAAGGIMVLPFGSTALITPLSYVVKGGKLTGSDNYSISASSGVCAFSETATYRNGHLNGKYQAVNGCSSDHGTFMTKQTCRFSQNMGTNFALKTC